MAARLGVDATILVIGATAELVCDAYDLVAKGFSMDKFKKVIEVMEDLRTLSSNVPAALPELRELDAEDTGKLSSAAYTAVKMVAEKLKA